jgi:serine/threonine protein kinase
MMDSSRSAGFLIFQSRVLNSSSSLSFFTGHLLPRPPPRLAPAAQIGLARALKLGFELSLAVSYLHTEAIEGHVVLHRDIKPSNVGLTSTGSVRLLDLGLARVVPLKDMLNKNENTSNSSTSTSTSNADGYAIRAGDSAAAGAAPLEEDGEAAAKKKKQQQQQKAAVAAAAAARRRRLLPPYEMTGYTGSLRYMAPEVATNQV